MRSFLSVLSPAPLILLIVFLFVSPVSDIVTAGDAEAKDVKGGSRAPIVFLGLDEFPGTSILDSKGQIDAKRYPGLAELAKSSTWFPNAHSIYDSTSRAWPAIMDGNYPVKEKRLPTAADHPDSIFAILGKSHAMNVSEEATTVCPRDLCKDDRLDEPFADRIRSITDDLGLVYKHMVAPPAIEEDLDTVSETWGDFGGGGGGSGAGSGAASASGSDAEGRRRQEDAREPARGAHRAAGRVDRLDQGHPPADAELQAPAAAARAVAVPARRAGLQPGRHGPDPPDLASVRTRTRARSTCSSSATCSRWASWTARSSGSSPT